MKPRPFELARPGSAGELLYAAVAQQRDAVLITEAERVDPGGRRIVWVNRAFSRLTGFSRKEVIGKTPGVTVGEKTDRETIRRIQTGIESKHPVREEILKYRKDGSTFWAELDIAPVFEADGSCSYFVCVMRDVTEQRRLADQPHELRKRLAALVRDASELLEGRHGPLSERQSDVVRGLQSNARHLAAELSDPKKR